MSTHLETLEIIGNILSFKSDTQLLKIKLQEENVDWDAVVKIGSGHLVLPAVYCKLKERELLNCLPEDLVAYLEEITSINRNRNQEILNEVTTISNLFNKHQIEHVFLKGAALLAGNYYSDIGERMIGDIDVLVAINQVQEAYALLQENNYTILENILYTPKLFKHRHLPRLVKETVMAAIEIHKKVLKKLYFKYLIPSEILNHKNVSEDFSIPNAEHLLEHNVLNLQLNDKGHYYGYINFRAAYDTCVILKKHPTLNIQQNYHKPLFYQYFLRHSLFLKDIDYQPTSIPNKIYLTFFKLKIKHPKFYHFLNRSLFYLDYAKFLINRLGLFIFNKEYRIHIVSDRKRVYREHKNKLFDS